MEISWRDHFSSPGVGLSCSLSGHELEVSICRIRNPHSSPLYVTSNLFQTSTAGSYFTISITS